MRNSDLLHGLKDVGSDHRISAERGVRDSNPYSRGTGSIPEELSFPPLSRAVARSTRPHQNPCHRRANHGWLTPLVVRGRHLTDSVAPTATRDHKKRLRWEIRGLPSVVRHRCVRLTPACSLLGSDRCRNTRRSREYGGMRSYSLSVATHIRLDTILGSMRKGLRRTPPQLMGSVGLIRVPVVVPSVSPVVGK